MRFIVNQYFAGQPIDKQNRTLFTLRVLQREPGQGLVAYKFEARRRPRTGADAAD